jgi:hypothetical protein
MTKYIRVTMPDGSKYDVPAFLVAENRALYYTEKEGSGVYNVEYKFTMENDDELLDWAANNMDWVDVKKYAIKVDTEKDTDFQEGWLNGDKEIVEK